jgi:hypothetical protein
VTREVTIARARLETDLDPLTARLRLEPQLATAELRPRGLPPSAVLCVRRIADPLPGRLTLDSAQARPPPEWERAFVDALERLLRSAARPAHEAVPANAEAVLFADRAELLACLARDARDGVAWTRWWWRNLSPPSSVPGTDPVVAAWLAAPEHVPAALALLATRGEATAFVAALPLAVAGQLARRVAAVFGAVALERVVAGAIQPGVATPSRDTPSQRHAREELAPPVAPPWERIVPEARAQPLAQARTLLLGVALALRRAPSIARSTAFAESAYAWLNAPQTPIVPAGLADGGPIRHDRVSLAARAASRPLPRDASSEEQSEAALPSPDASALPHPRASGRPPRTAPSFEEAPLATVEAAGEATVEQPSTVEERRDVPPPEPRSTRRRARAIEPTRPARRRRKPTPVSPEPVVSAPVDTVVEAVEPAQVHDEPWEMPAVGIETELGGLFYLLNLLLYLELYGDFTQPLERGLSLDPWRCVALVGRRLVTDARDDRAWSVLDRLAGPSTFRPPRAWRVPRAWLEPFDDDGVWRWSTAGGVLRIEHPAGFLATAVPNGTLARELRRLGVTPTLRRTTLRREPAQPLTRWAVRLARYADARLRVALDTDDVERMLIRKRARVFVTPTHVDVVLSLAELPLEVRFAGLDRTPGWIPAAGRFVSFHFE